MKKKRQEERIIKTFIETNQNKQNKTTRSIKMNDIVDNMNDERKNIDRSSTKEAEAIKTTSMKKIDKRYQNAEIAQGRKNGTKRKKEILRKQELISNRRI